jgi:hypothetical protein
MIILNKGKINSVVFTLNESSVASGEFFLQLYSNQNKKNTLVYLSGDTSLNTVRYNRYDIDETVLNLTVGEYDYFVHEFTGGTPDINLSEGIVETGKCIVIGSGTTVNIFNNNNTEYTFI